MSNIAIAWKFWILWVLVCIGGGIGCFILGFLIFTTRNQNSLGAFVGLSMIGILWATPQYLLLKNYTPKINGIWVLVSVAGTIASSVIAGYILKVLDRNLGWAVIGAVAAIFPYLVLRPHFLRASSWILANGVGLFISIVTGEVVFRVVSKAIEQPPTGDAGDSGLSALAEATSVLFYSSLVTGVVSLGTYGAITGGTLVWLLRHPRRK
ncbi:hypothetical protein [Synechocystis sp. PCC 7509]|uniref:hypothetical protein n=1 Tax=Synechocystis sp. PCC 7509 TaxID=927677 RepID=UPI0002ABD20B|nr:hypothetical protein [Synechocystis sp. PCC 7509]